MYILVQWQSLVLLTFGDFCSSDDFLFPNVLELNGN